MDDKDDFLNLAACAAAVIILRRRARRRLHRRQKLWSRQWLVDRNTERGILNHIEFDLRDDMCGFHGFLRMDTTDFNIVLGLIMPDIQRIAPKEMLVVTLRYLASGE